MTRNNLIGIVVIILIIVLGYFAWQERQAPAASSSASTSTATTATNNVSITVSSSTANSTGGYTIKPITSSSAPTAPNYKTPLTYPASMSADEQAQDQSQFMAVQTALASSSTDYSAWLELGILREGTGDYSGAAAAWKYVTEIYPGDPTAFANLGDLYANYLHQRTQGIAYYKQAIKLDPTHEETFYDNLAQIYLAEGDKTDAKAVLQQGVTAQVIGYQNLQNELNSIK